jgi:hypothetical protein
VGDSKITSRSCTGGAFLFFELPQGTNAGIEERQQVSNEHIIKKQCTVSVSIGFSQLV